MEQDYKNPYKPLEFNVKEEGYALVCCPKCDSDISAKNINLSEKMAKCDNCNAIFSIKNEVLSLQQQESEEVIPKPVGVDVLEYNDEVELTLKQPMSILYIIVACLSPFLILLFFAMYFDKEVAWAMYPGFASIFAFVFSAVKLIKGRKDKIYITVNRKELVIEYRPNNFLTDQIYLTRNIEQLFVKRDHNGLHLSMLVNEEDGQRAQKLIGRFTDITKAKYVEQEVEKYLGIKNRKVSGEVL